MFDGISSLIAGRPAGSSHLPAPAAGTTQPTSGSASTHASGVTPAAIVDGFSTRLGSVFNRTFDRSLETVFEQGAAGAFDDPGLALAEQLAAQRLRVARNQVSGTLADDVAAQRDLYAVRVAQSEARLQNVSTSLAQQFPAAAKLPSASTGQWDPATFTPRSAEEAEALAQRLVVDATEGAARLEIVQTQLDAARLEARQHGSTPETQAKVRQLEAAYDRQRAYVDSLATAVDRQSGGSMTQAGIAAMAGRSLRNAGDIPVDELVDAMRTSGMSDAQIQRVVGASELAVEQERTPGGSVRLKRIATKLTETLILQFNHQREAFAERMRDRDQRRDAERQALDARAHERRQRDQIARANAQTRAWLDAAAAARAQARRHHA